MNDGGSAVASPHACCFVPWLLLCDGQRCPCFLLVAMLLRCFALPPYPRRTNGPASVAVANANALQLPLPPKPGCPVSPVLWVLRHAVGHLRQPWDPRDRARQEPPVGARCPVTPVDGMISGYDYDYDYIYIYIYIYVYINIYIYIYIWYMRALPPPLSAPPPGGPEDPPGLARSARPGAEGPQNARICTFYTECYSVLPVYPFRLPVDHRNCGL